MTAPADSRISDERLNEIEAGLDGVTTGPWQVYSEPEVGMFGDVFAGDLMAGTFAPIWDNLRNIKHVANLDPDTIRALITELRERRAQAVTPVAWRVEWPKEGLLEHFSNEKTARGMEAGGATVTPLYAAPPPAAGVTGAMNAAGYAAINALVPSMGKYLRVDQMAVIFDAMRSASLSAQDREE